MKVIFFALIASAILSSSAYPQNVKNLKFINKTGMTVTRVFMSPHNAAKWSGNLLTAGRIASNDAYQVGIPTGTKNCSWDFRVYDDKNKEYLVSNVNICDMSSVVAMKQGPKIEVTSAAQYESKHSSGATH